MSSKFRTGDNSYGGADIGSSKGITAANGLDSAVTRLSSKMAQGQPKASRNTQVTHTPSGVIINPIVRSKKQKSVSSHPWLVTLKKDGSSNRATVQYGAIYDGLLSLTEITVEEISEDGLEVEDGDLICLEYTYAIEESPPSINIIVVVEEEYEPFTDDGGDPGADPPVAPVILTVVQHIARFLEGDSDKLFSDQISRNNFALTDICKDGMILKHFTAL